MFRAQKQEEIADIPDQWRSTISAVFKDETDFYILERETVDKKLKYISIKANEAKNTTLTDIIQRLDTIRKENTATSKIKDRVASLRSILDAGREIILRPYHI